MDCTETSAEDKAYMRWGIQCEGSSSVLDAMEQQNTIHVDLPTRSKYRGPA